MIRQLNHTFVLDTPNTTYIFTVLPSGHLEHLYYGKRIHVTCEEDILPLTEKRVCLAGNAVQYSQEYPTLGLEDVCLEMSSHGKGDIREPFIEVTHHDGSYTSDFLFESAKIKEGKDKFDTLPASYEENNEVDELVVTLVDKQYQLTLELYYFVFRNYDIISRSSKFMNTSENTVKLNRLMSTQLDFSRADYIFTTFHGAWAREMKKYQTDVGMSNLINE